MRERKSEREPTCEGGGGERERLERETVSERGDNTREEDNE